MNKVFRLCVVLKIETEKNKIIFLSTEKGKNIHFSFPGKKCVWQKNKLFYPPKSAVKKRTSLIPFFCPPKS